MRFEILPVDEKGYLRIQVYDNMDRQFANEMAEAVITRQQQVNIDRLLYDLRNSRNVETIPDNYFWANQDAVELDLSTKDRIALLTAADDSSHDFIEVVMRNTGFNARIFKTEEQAIEWLEAP
jgi:hypothetical protein